MSRHFPPLSTLLIGALVFMSGCHPQQPFYFFEDGDLSHYLDVATDIDYPDVAEDSLCEVDGDQRPFSLDNNNPSEIWDLRLEDAIQYSLQNSKVMKSIGGQIQGPPDFLIRNPEFAPTIYDPAITESNPRFGTEAALSAFDAQFTSSLFWERNDTPRNVPVDTTIERIFPRTIDQDLGSFQAQISKTAATGGTWIMRHIVQYDQNNGPRLYPSDWNVQLEAEFRQPLLQGAGAQFNRIAGPGAIPGFDNGVMIARIRTDIALADFEAGVRNLVSDVEVAYWELYYAYRFLDAMIVGRNAGLRTWRETWVKFQVGDVDAWEEARARQQYFQFRTAMEQALHELYAAESKLRYLMGLASTDGRLIRPNDEPTTAKVVFDWCESRNESLCRSVELREQKWIVKQSELQLISSKNYLLPRLDAVGTYRWRGLGDDLIQSDGGTGNPALIGSNAYQSLTSGNFQEWHVGLDFSLPIGFRKEMAGVRHAQLLLARERAKLQEQELEVVHQLGYAIRDLESLRVITQTNFNRRIAAKAEVKTAETKMLSGLRDWTLETVLDAQRRLAEAEVAYYRSLIDYNKSISQVHFRKGSLLEYNGVCLAEGPWPGKAYFDAHGRARARDASFFLDYGYTRPKVVSRGPYQQHVGGGQMAMPGEGEVQFEGGGEMPELVPAPEPRPVPIESMQEPPAPKPADDAMPGVLREPVIDGASSSTGIKRVRGRWSTRKQSGGRNESLTNPTPAETHRTASGWKGV